MTGPRDIRDDLEPGVADELVGLAERLDRERPVPAAAFRGELRRRLLVGAAGRSRPARPARLRLLIAGYAGAGTLLLLLGAAGVAGAGPLGA